MQVVKETDEKQVVNLRCGNPVPPRANDKRLTEKHLICDAWKVGCVLKESKSFKTSSRVDNGLNFVGTNKLEAHFLEVDLHGISLGG